MKAQLWASIVSGRLVDSIEDRVERHDDEALATSLLDIASREEGFGYIS
jgi:hypothetical protein